MILQNTFTFRSDLLYDVISDLSPIDGLIMPYQFSIKRGGEQMFSYKFNANMTAILN